MSNIESRCAKLPAALRSLQVWCEVPSVSPGAWPKMVTRRRPLVDVRTDDPKTTLLRAMGEPAAFKGPREKERKPAHLSLRGTAEQIELANQLIVERLGKGKGQSESGGARVGEKKEFTDRARCAGFLRLSGWPPKEGWAPTRESERPQGTGRSKTKERTSWGFEEVPRGPEDGSKTVPRRPQDGPKTAQDRPRSAQDRRRRAKDGLKMEVDGEKCVPS